MGFMVDIFVVVIPSPCFLVVFLSFHLGQWWPCGSYWPFCTVWHFPRLQLIGGRKSTYFCQSTFQIVATIDQEMGI